MIWPNSSGTVLTHILSQDDQHVLLKSATFMGMWTLIYTVAGNHKNQPYNPITCSSAAFTQITHVPNTVVTRFHNRALWRLQMGNLSKNCWTDLDPIWYKIPWATNVCHSNGISMSSAILDRLPVFPTKNTNWNLQQWTVSHRVCNAKTKHTSSRLVSLREFGAIIITYPFNLHRTSTCKYQCLQSSLWTVQLGSYPWLSTHTTTTPILMASFPRQHG